MKNVKKALTFMLAAAMMASTMQVSFADEQQAVTTEEGNADSGVYSRGGEDITSSVVYVEDFEDYDVGIIRKVPENGYYGETVGNLKFSLYPGDILEIAEENGNKYLKLTRGSTNTTGTYVQYLFPETYTDKKMCVSYDFYPEVHSKHFTSFGTLFDESKKDIQYIISYSGNVYVDGNTNSSYYVSGIGNKNNYNGYGTITQTVDLRGGEGNYTFESGVLKPDNTYMKATKTRTVTADNIAGIKWNIRNHSSGESWNGPDRTDDRATNPAIYRIDNIVVEDLTAFSDGKTKITEDFDGYKEKQLFNSISFAKITPQTGDKVEIATDPVTNSKAIKVTKGENESKTSLDFDFAEVEGKTVKLSYDIRYQNHSRLLQGFPKLNTGMNFFHYMDDIYWESSFNSDTVFANYAKIGNYSDVQHVEITHDPNLETDNVKAVITRGDGTVYTGMHTAGAGQSFRSAIFNFAYSSKAPYNSHMGTAEGDGVYWIDNVCAEIVSLKLVNSSISYGETVSADRNLVLTFNEAVANNAAESISVTKNDEPLNADEYTVTVAENNTQIIVSSASGMWDFESKYSVTVGELLGINNILPFAGTQIIFTTKPDNTYVLEDNFSNLDINLGDKFVGPATVNIGNITVTLLEGDSIEYAYDEAVGKNGFRLRKGATAGSMIFDYIFPETYENGKYRVKVSEKVSNHSKGHDRWPALLSGSLTEDIGKAIYGAGYWIGATGSFGVDRFGVDWSSNSTSRWIAGYEKGANNIVWGEVTTGLGYKYGVYKPDTNEYFNSVEPGKNVASVGGVRMRITDGGTNYVDGYVKGTDVDEDVLNNPNNDGIAWIYGVTVEKIYIDVVSTSFAENESEFDSSQKLTITFNEALDVATVTPDTFQIFKNDEQISSYEYSVQLSEDKKTVSIQPVGGLEYSATYKIKVTTEIQAVDAVISHMRKEKEYVINTVPYIDTTAPDIVWSTIVDGSAKVDPATESVIMVTDDVLLDKSTVNADNVKVYEDGVLLEDCTISAYDNFGVKVNFNALKKGTTYKIVVSGLKSGGENALDMTKNYTLNFTVREDIYVSNEVSKISVDGTKSVITGELFNKSEEAVTYKIIGVLKNSEGSILNIAFGSEGTLPSGDVAEIEAAMPKNADAENYELYIWDRMSSIKPLVKKEVFASVNERTYGYDNYADPAKPLRIAFIGGSITQQGKYTTPLKKSLTEFLQKDNPDRSITYVNHAVDGGVGGTGSDLGVFRLQKDVIDTNPDLVFVEFAVNDASNTNRVVTMEGILRQLMKLDHQPMVVLIDVTTEDHKSLKSIEDYKPLMQAYGTGYVNLAEYLIENEASEENPDGAFVWKNEYLEQYPNATALTGSDGVHPSQEGGAIYASYISKVLTENHENFFKKMNYVQDAVSGYEYRNPRMVSWKDGQFDENWTQTNEMSWSFRDGVATAKSAGAKVTYTFTGSTIGLYVPKSTSGGSAAYSIDNGAYTGNVDISSGTTTKMEMASMIVKNLGEGEHTITLTVNDLGDKYFKFGYFIVD